MSRTAPRETLPPLTTLDDFIDRKVKAIVKEELRSIGSSRKRLVDLAAVGPPKRFTYREARSGKIAGAVKMNGHWYAPETAVENWIATYAEQSPRPSRDLAEQQPKSGGLDALRSRLGLVRVG